MVRIEYFDLEKKEKLDAIYRARECIEDERIPGCFMQTVMLAGTIVALVSSFFVAGSWNVMIPVILVLFFLPEMLIRKKGGEKRNRRKKKTVTLEREKRGFVGIIFPKRGGKRKSRCSRPAIGSLSSGGKERAPAFSGMAHQKDGDRSSDNGRSFACRGAACMLWTARGGMSGAENPGGRTGRCAVLLRRFRRRCRSLGNAAGICRKVCHIRSATSTSQRAAGRKKSAVLTLNDRIVGTDVVFTYDGEQGRNVLDGVSFEIRRGQKSRSGWVKTVPARPLS